MDSIYKSTLDYLFSQLPAFERDGQSGYKPGLERVRKLSELFGNPHKHLRCIHVAGTNGKGSTAHTLAAILQSAGYKTGLFTSPHLIDFRERIRIDGEKIGCGDVVDFINRYKEIGTDIKPSFFELTTIMAFEYFLRRKVDVAVVEVGLGGRLDSTNIITPDLSVITNISFDHTSLLGNTLEAIAIEKAGIIKPGVNVVVGEAEGSVRSVFETVAHEVKAPVVFAQDMSLITERKKTSDGFIYRTQKYGIVKGELCGDCQPNNASTILAAVDILCNIGYKISAGDIAKGFENVCRLTGLAGRWEVLCKNPIIVCDTGHNTGGWQYIVRQLKSQASYLHLVIGFVNDKDVGSIMKMISEAELNAQFYFTQPNNHRALPAMELRDIAAGYGLRGKVCSSVSQAVNEAIAAAGSNPDQLLFVGGSNYVVAELMSNPVVGMDRSS